MASFRTRCRARRLAIVPMLLATAACGAAAASPTQPVEPVDQPGSEPSGEQAAAAGPSRELPEFAVGQPEDRRLFEMNLLLDGFVSQAHNDAATAVALDECLAEHGWETDFASRMPPPVVSVSERAERAAGADYAVDDFGGSLLIDHVADFSIGLSDADGARFAEALEGGGSEANPTRGCIHVAEERAASPLRLSPDELEQYGDAVFAAVFGNTLEADMARYLRCMGDRGITADGLAEIAERAASRSGDDRLAILRADDECQREFLDDARFAAAVDALAQLVDRGVITDAQAHSVLYVDSGGR